MNSELFQQKDFLQLVGAGLAVLIGITVILVAGRKRNTRPMATPIAPASIDYHAIMKSIEKATNMQQLVKLADVCERFYDLHYSRISREVLKALYASLLEAISKRKMELNAQAEVPATAEV